MCSRVISSSAPNGSSISSSGGWAASARAMATRCCIPPESCHGMCVSELRKLDQLEQLHRARPPPRLVPTLQLERQLDVLRDGAPFEQARMLEGHAVVVVEPRLPRGLPVDDARRRSSARCRSAISRSRVDFPHPDGPISDTNSPGSTVRSMSTSASTAFGRPPLNDLAQRPNLDGRHRMAPVAASLIQDLLPEGGSASSPGRSTPRARPSPVRGGGGEHGGEHLRRVARRLPCVFDDQPPDASGSPVEISATTTPITATPSPPLQRRDHERHGRREPELEQGLAPRRCVGVHQFERCGRRGRRQTLQRPHGDGEEGEERSEHRRREPPGPLEPTDVELPAPADDERRQARSAARSARPPGRAAGLAPPPCSGPSARPGRSRRRSDDEAGECEAEREPRPGQDDEEDRSGRAASLGAGIAREHLPHVGHRDVVRARQDRRARRVSPVLAARSACKAPTGPRPAPAPP